MSSIIDNMLDQSERIRIYRLWCDLVKRYPKKYRIVWYKSDCKAYPVFYEYIPRSGFEKDNEPPTLVVRSEV